MSYRYVSVVVNMNSGVVNATLEIGQNVHDQPVSMLTPEQDSYLHFARMSIHGQSEHAGGCVYPINSLQRVNVSA